MRGALLGSVFVELIRVEVVQVLRGIPPIAQHEETGNSRRALERSSCRIAFIRNDPLTIITWQQNKFVRSSYHI